MTNPLLAGAIQKPLSFQSSMLGGPHHAIVHTTEGDSLAGALSAYEHGGFCPHITWDPVTGVVWQHVPANRSSSAVVNAPGGVETNRYGAVCIQIEVVGYAIHPFTDETPWSALKGWDSIHAWLKAWGIPDAWPAGSPLPYPKSYGVGNGNRSTSAWAKSGYFGHSQVPENDHGDPGAITISKLTGSTPRPPGGDDLTQAEADQLSDVHAALKGYAQGRGEDPQPNVNGKGGTFYDVFQTLGTQDKPAP